MLKVNRVIEDLRIIEDGRKIVFYSRITHGKPRYEGTLPKFVINIPKYIVRKYSLRRGIIVKVALELVERSSPRSPRVI